MALNAAACDSGNGPTAAPARWLSPVIQPAVPWLLCDSGGGPERRPPSPRMAVAPSTPSMPREASPPGLWGIPEDGPTPYTPGQLALSQTWLRACSHPGTIRVAGTPAEAGTPTPRLEPNMATDSLSLYLTQLETMDPQVPLCLCLLLFFGTLCRHACDTVQDKARQTQINTHALGKA